MKQKGFFDEDDRLKKLTELGDSLERLSNGINWELFRPLVESAFKKNEPNHGGRPAFDHIMMFKVVILQRCNNIGDDKTEMLINDRLSFQRFLGLRLCDTVPDAKTIWNFKERLAKAGMAEKLFDLFGEQLERQGMITHEGSIVDATFVDVPRQRNKRDENKTIKEGNIPDEWEKPENKNKLRQKDTDARWTKKNNEAHYGYKNHVKVDKESKLIEKSITTNASTHDSQALEGLMDEKDKEVFADSAYVGKKLHERLKKENPNLKISIHEKGYKKHPITEEQKKSNNEKSKTRVRVEHVFGYMTNSMNEITIRSIGMARAEFNIAFMNLTYNLNRYVYLKKAGFRSPNLASVVKA